MGGDRSGRRRCRAYTTLNVAEWDFIQSLSYREQLEEEDAAFVKLVYTSRLNKVSDDHLCI